MPVSLFQVDAFTSEPFKGNPAAVCLLSEERSTDWMQHVAAEMNLSETAFVVERSDGFGLRWFTPTTEVPLCGHATLASAHTLWESDVLERQQPARFHTLSGLLMARLNNRRIEMDLPAFEIVQEKAPASALEALGVEASFIGRTPDRNGDLDYLLELESEEAVRQATPNLDRLRRDVAAGWIVTARGNDERADFVSRYFAPAWGVDEDPVTGAAHCSLVPYWSHKLGRDAVTGYQASQRGGFVHGCLAGHRVKLSGNAVTVLRGELLC